MHVSQLKLKSHRCEDSLKSKVSVSYINKGDILFNYPPISGWYLLTLQTNYDYDSHWMQPQCLIKHCPFCGVVLQNETEFFLFECTEECNSCNIGDCHIGEDGFIDYCLSVRCPANNKHLTCDEIIL